jgi:hypothetical protein
VLEFDAGQPHVEQLVHRQLAARIGEADDDFVDLVLAHDRGNVLDRPDDARIEQRRADLRLVGIDEADDLQAAVVRWCSSRASSIAAWLVPTSRMRSRGPTRTVSQAKPIRQATTDTATRPAETATTPRPRISAGNQK